MVGGAVQDADAGDTSTMVETLITTAEHIEAVLRPPHVEENTVMLANLYSGDASFISRCIVPVRFVASRMWRKTVPPLGVERHDDDRFVAAEGGLAALGAGEAVAACSSLVQFVLQRPCAVGRQKRVLLRLL